MNAIVFNICLLVGWLMVVIGIALVSIPAALVVGGVVLLFLTLKLAFWAGVLASKRGADVPGQ